MKRPLSPHLQIYKPQLTSVLSIMHRITGVILSSIIIALPVGLMGYHCDPMCFWIKAYGYMYMFSFFYHLANGCRYLAWSLGLATHLKAVYASGWIVLAIALLSSIYVGVML
jgi:succinate dehydrogenase / fumarate reductase cytochrome b subunit